MQQTNHPAGSFNILAHIFWHLRRGLQTMPDIRLSPITKICFGPLDASQAFDDGVDLFIRRRE